MNFILESKSFFNLQEVKSILSRFKNSGYVSSSMAKKLDHLFMSDDVSKRLFNKCHQLIDYFYSGNRDLMDDIIFEFFDATGYDYEVKYGLYMPMQKFNLTFSDNFDNSANKEYLLFILILEKIMNLQYYEIDKAKEEIQKRKDKDDWIRHPRNREFNFSKLMKSIELIYPSYIVTFKKRDLENLQHLIYHDTGSYQNIEGFKHGDFYTYRSNSILNRIKQRLSYFKETFGDLYTIEYNSNASYESPRRWWGADNELFLNDNPIILKGEFIIKFKL